MPRSTYHCTLIIISIIYQNLQNMIFRYKDKGRKNRRECSLICNSGNRFCNSIWLDLDTVQCTGTVVAKYSSKCGQWDKISKRFDTIEYLQSSSLINQQTRIYKATLQQILPAPGIVPSPMWQKRVWAGRVGLANGLRSGLKGGKRGWGVARRCIESSWCGLDTGKGIYR